MRTETILDLTDLKKVAAECSRCHVETILSVVEDLLIVSDKCPSCKEDFPEKALKEYVASYRKLIATSHKITVRFPGAVEYRTATV
jgi:hypothetical protein